MNTKVVEIKEYSNKEVGLLAQAILTELVLIFLVISILSSAFMPALYGILTLLMFKLAYNNIKIFRKRYMTSVYVITGLFVLITTIVEYVF